MLYILMLNDYVYHIQTNYIIIMSAEALRNVMLENNICAQFSTKQMEFILHLGFMCRVGMITHHTHIYIYVLYIYIFIEKTE